MTIAFDDNTKMKAALCKVSEEEYFEALCLFAQVDSYESLLNQIGCHAMLTDVGFATLAFRRLLGIYGVTHNCLADLADLGDGAAEVLDYFGNCFSGPRERDPDKISADPELLGQYSWDDVDDAVWENLRMLTESVNEGETQPKSKFIFKCGGKEYQAFVRDKLLQSMITHKTEEIPRYATELMSFDSDDPLILELQINMAQSQKNFKQGVVIAERIAEQSNVSYRGIIAAAELLNQMDGHEDVTEKLLKQVLERYDDFTDANLVELLCIACGKLGDSEITLRIAERLFSIYDFAGCMALRICVRAFCNCKKYEDARRAAVLLLRAAPWDAVGQMLLDNINDGLLFQRAAPKLVESPLNVIDIPEQLSFVAMMKIVKCLQSDCVIDDECIKATECLLQACNCSIAEQDTEAFIKYSTAITSLLAAAKPASENFLSFCKRALCNIFPEVGLSSAFLAKLIEIGCRDKVFVALSESAYVLDLGKLTLGDDKNFREAFACCAALRKVDVKRLEKSYKLLSDSVSVEGATPRAIAYALLALSYKNFFTGREIQYFASDDSKLYRSYVVLG